MKILRHEAGHAIDTAFGLHQHPNYRRVFGNPQAPYPMNISRNRQAKTLFCTWIWVRASTSRGRFR